MKIKSHEVDGVTVFDVTGEMYGGAENMELVNMVTELAKEKKLDLLINLSKVKWISSTGLGILVSARSRYNRERRLGGFATVAFLTRGILLIN